MMCAPSRPDLTAAEMQVATLVLSGHHNAQIALLLGVSVHTVKFHRSNILAKNGCEVGDGIGFWVRLDRQLRSAAT